MLDVITRDEAVAAVTEQAGRQPLATELLPLSQVYGRVLAQDVRAGENVPPFDRSTVDGYAVRAADTFGAGASIPAQLDVAGEIPMGQAPAFSLHRGQCARIATGGMLPPGADAAVMVEHTDAEHGLCLVYRPVSPGENVTKAGDDIRQGQTALPKGRRIGAAETAVLAALGIDPVPVLKKPRVAVLSTGDEITGRTDRPGQIRDINGALLCAALTGLGAEAVFLGAVPDDRAQILRAVAEGVASCDAVLLSGGSSAGTRDMTVDVINGLGSVRFHGLAMKPGKPTVFGVCGGKPVFGLPGHPLAAYFVFRLVFRPYLEALQGGAAEGGAVRRVVPMGENVPSNHGREEFLCVRINEKGEAVPLHTRSGVISVLTKADGFIRIPRNCEGIAAGTKTEVFEL